jgi:hypothetical protein
MTRAVISNFIVESPQGSACATCNLPSREAKLMRIPGLPGLYCSVLCAEQGIANRGCHWCGAKLDGAHGNQKYCSEGCKDKGEALRYGDGARFLAWLTEHAPGLLYQTAERERCPHCGASLAGKRRDAKFCDDTCSKAHRREKAKCGSLARTAPAKNAGFVRVENRVNTIALTGAGSGRNRGNRDVVARAPAVAHSLP